MKTDEQAMLSTDTSRAAEDEQVRRWREMSPSEKAGIVTSLCQAVDALAVAGIRHRYPAASDRECFLRFAALRLGRDLAQRVYPDLLALSDVP